MTSASSPFHPFDTDRRRWAWSGYAAFVAGLLYALVTAYRAGGGDTGLKELGGTLAELARERDPMLIFWGLLLGAATWVFVRPGGPREQ